MRRLVTVRALPGRGLEANLFISVNGHQDVCRGRTGAAQSLGQDFGSCSCKDMPHLFSHLPPSTAGIGMSKMSTNDTRCKCFLFLVTSPEGCSHGQAEFPLALE